MPYAVNDLVTVTAALGGWSGYVAEIVGGPGAGLSYRVVPVYGTEPDVGERVCQEADIASSGVTPTWEADDPVVINGHAATVLAELAPDSAHPITRYRIEVDDPPRVLPDDVIYSYTAEVPAWRLALEN